MNGNATVCVNILQGLSFLVVPTAAPQPKSLPSENEPTARLPAHVTRRSPPEWRPIATWRLTRLPHWRGARYGYTSPVLVDWDGDGLLDLMLGDATAVHKVFLNRGTAKTPRLAYGECAT